MARTKRILSGRLWGVVLITAILIVAVVLVGRPTFYRSFAEPPEEPMDWVLTDVTKDSLRLVYRTGKPVDTLVQYGPVGGPNDQIAGDLSGPARRTTHLVQISFLTPGQTYDVLIGRTKIAVSTLPAGVYVPEQAKVVTGSLATGTPDEFADTVVVLHTKDKYFATRPDKSGNWLVTWVNYTKPDGTLEITYPISPVEVIIYPANRPTYAFPFSWLDVRTISAGSPVKLPREDQPAVKETFWDQLKKFLFTFVPKFY